MTRRGPAQFCWLSAAMCMASLARAGVWGTQPVLGVAADYYTNPALINLPDTAESHAALLVDAPTTYQGDGAKFNVLPSFRLSDSRGYSSLDSDYAHLTALGELDTERNVFSASAMAARDSSLYHDYFLNGSTGVRRDTATADLNWDGKLTERMEIDTDLNSQRVRYGESVGVGAPDLVDYKYTSLAPTFSWLQSERGKLTASASVGRYNSLNGQTESTSTNLQLGFVQQLSEIWSLSASAGYSRAGNKIDTEVEELEFTQLGPIFVLVPVTLKANQNGSVYAFNVSRQTERLLLSAISSRQLVPTGLAFLSRQESYELKASFNKTARWVLNADLQRVEYNTPENGGASVDLHLTNLQFTAVWQWTEHWTLTANAVRVLEKYGTVGVKSAAIDVASSGVSLELSRQFDWKSFQ
jgi:hypothetical protein